MQVTFCDGLPASAFSDASGDDSRRICTTQSPRCSGSYPNPESFYTPSPSLCAAETSLPGPQDPLHFPPAADTATQTYSLPQTLAADSPHVMWPTPPATACGDFEDYMYHSPPTSVCCGPHGASHSTPSPVGSPRSWPSPEPHHLAYHSEVWGLQEHTPPPFSIYFDPNMSNDDYCQSEMNPPPYANVPYPDSNMEAEYLFPDMAVMTPDHMSSAMSDRSISPIPHHVLGNESPYGEEDIGHAPDQGDSGANTDDANRVDEPYAKLIHRAFMSRENHAMTLQELYQWFRDNTDKADGEHNGWQNSIRHNLSLNEAFVKLEVGSRPGDSTTDGGERKRSSHWVLMDWAAENGVRSTTFYRKGNNNRRGGAGNPRRQTNTQPQSARATSGRKGGITASRTRSAISRAALRKQQAGELVPSMDLTNPVRSVNVFPRQRLYARQQGQDFISSAEGDPVTPPEMPAGGVLFAESMYDSQRFTLGTSQEYYCGPEQSQYQFPHQQHSTSQVGPDAFYLQDVTNIYEPPSMPQQFVENDPSQLASYLPAAFGNLFVDDSGEPATGTATMPRSLHYGWNNGVQYRS